MLELGLLVLEELLERPLLLLLLLPVVSLPLPWAELPWRPLPRPPPRGCPRPRPGIGCRRWVRRLEGLRLLVRDVSRDVLRDGLRERGLPRAGSRVLRLWLRPGDFFFKEAPPLDWPL